MNVLVLGAGRTGVDAANLAYEKGFDVVLSEQKLETPFLNELNPGVLFKPGKQNDDLLDEQPLVIVSPGIPFRTKIIQEALARGLEIKSEIEFALHYYIGRVFGITGTNGKSTTTAMLAHILNENNVSCCACGNIGRTISSILLDNLQPKALAVELSSYQLHSSDKLILEGSCLLNFTADHLAYHETIENYFRAKTKIIEFTRGPVFVSDDFHDLAALYSSDRNYSVKLVSQKVREELRQLAGILSAHDIINAGFATELALLNDIDLPRIISALKTYESLPHRFKRYKSPRGTVFINDSKATNVDSTLTALRSVEQPCLLLLGGQPKGESFAPIGEYKDKISEIICFGEAAAKLRAELNEYFDNLQFAHNLADVFNKFATQLRQSPITLFSPACASFDEFRNFEERGHFFEAKMQDLFNS